MDIHLQSVAVLNGIVDLILLVLTILESVQPGGDTLFSVSVWRVVLTIVFVGHLLWYGVFEAAAASWHWCDCHTRSYRAYIDGIVVCSGIVCFFIWVDNDTRVLVLYVTLWVPRAVLAVATSSIWLYSAPIRHTVGHSGTHR